MNTFRTEVNEFNRINGNKTYTSKDMLRYLCSKLTKMDVRIARLENGTNGLETIRDRS